MKRVLTATAVAAALMASGSASAMSVFADFTGDELGDTMHEMRVGDTVAVDIWAQLTEDEDLAGGLLSFGTEATLNPVGIANVTAGSIAAFPWFVGPDLTLNPDKASAAGGNIPGVTGKTKLFSIDLKAMAGGSTMLELSTWKKSLGFDANVLADGTVLDDFVDYEGTEIRVVPIPAAAWLFGSALLGLAGFARRRKA